jgi:hypothetical protein
MPSPSSRPIYLRDQADKCRWHASQIADAETQAELLNEPPRFSFTQGRFSKAGLIVGLPDTHAAHKEAVAMFVGLIRDIARRTGNASRMANGSPGRDRQARFQAQASWGSAGVGNLGRR